MKFTKTLIYLLPIFMMGCGHNNEFKIDKQKFATKYFQEDARWYIDNIPSLNVPIKK